uniref:restin homolog n=1 Tax=Scatophagus argus TaxID=75038 RepID=UPI001ED8099E|nr:restin homolog [Scatophagus argus]
MAGVSYFIWIFVLLCCVFQASDNRHVHLDVDTSTQLKDIISKIPITLPEGTDTQNINFTSIVLKICTGMKEQLTQLNTQLQQTSLRNSQLNNEAFGLRSEVRLLKLQLAACSSTASAITGSYQTQLLNKMKQLLETFDSDTFLILRIIKLTREVNTLQKRINNAANSTETTTDVRELQRELEEKNAQLTAKTQQIDGNHTNSLLILQIISLQNQIWDLEQAKSRKGEARLQPDRRSLALQEQLDRKISLLRRKGDAVSVMLELISVNSKITAMQRLISAHIEESSTNTAIYQKQWRQKVDLLKKKIIELNRDEHNTELTKEILKLQAEVEHFAQLVLNAKRTTDAQLRELRVMLEEERKRHGQLQKQLEEADYAQAQLIIKSISIMKEVRELEDDKQDQTSTSQATTLQTLLQAKEREYAKAQAEIRELQRKLKSAQRSGPEERHERVQIEFEQKIAELNRTADSKAVLILNVLNLHNELTTLKEMISATGNPERKSELQRQLERKQKDLDFKTAEIERLFANPRIILTLIELQDEIWELQKNAANETSGAHMKELQNRLDGLITEVEDKGGENTNLILKILTLQSQVEHLQKQLSNQMLKTSQANQLRNDLVTKREELQKYINELNEKDQTNARLILTVTDLHNQLRNFENEKHNEGRASSAIISKLREQLQEKEEQHTRDRAEINSLQNQLNQTEAQCSSFEQKLKDLQNDLDAKMKELQSKSDTVSSLALQVSTLTLQLEELKRQLQNTDSETKIKELQKLIDEKNNELTLKTEELKARSAQPQRLLQIITIQTEIEKLATVAANDTDYYKMRALQDHLNDLIDGIQDENNENTKLMFKILSQQDEITRLKKQEERLTQAEQEKIKDLENELEGIRNQIKEKTAMLESSDTRIANLSAQIMELHKKIKPLENEISDLREEQEENLEELRKRLDLSTKQLQNSELQLKEADAKNFNSIMEIADLRVKLKTAKRQASKAETQQISELEQQIQTQQRQNKQLENANKDLKQQVKEMEMCCSDTATQCDDLQRQLQQSHEDADRLQQQLHEKDTTLSQLQQDLEEKTREFNKLLDDYNTLQQERNKLEDDVQALQDKLADVEDKTIRARKMTFDQNTAHPRIALSADDTELSTGAEIQNVPDNPGRFDVALAVLGKTGFSTGRQYWEVSVDGKLCYHIGMASESVQRKGTITFRPETGFWTIIMNKQGQLKALDGRQVIIPVQTQPLTLGILLDYKKGQISFYDSSTRSHLYSFVGKKFTDKIYPFINFCVDDTASGTPIVSLSPGSIDWIKS